MVRLTRMRRWKTLAWSTGFLMTPAIAVAWWPQHDVLPNRWAHSEIYLALACTEAGEVQAVIDALDDARAIGPAAAEQVDFHIRGDFRPHLERLLARPLAHARSLDRARLLRQLPEHRAEARTLIDSALERDPRDPAALRESGAWWLGQSDDPMSRLTAAQRVPHRRDQRARRSIRHAAAVFARVGSHAAFFAGGASCRPRVGQDGAGAKNHRQALTCCRPAEDVGPRGHRFLGNRETAVSGRGVGSPLRRR